MLKDMKWDGEHLNVLLELLDVLGPVSDQLSQMTSRDIAGIVTEQIWGELNISTPHSAFIGEIIERLLIQGDYVRGDHEAPIPAEWEQRK